MKGKFAKIFVKGHDYTLFDLSTMENLPVFASWCFRTNPYDVMPSLVTLLLLLPGSFRLQEFA